MSTPSFEPATSHDVHRDDNDPIRRRVALATCVQLPTGDADDHAMISSLAVQGIDASWQIWDDPRVVWTEFDAVLIRSTWDYTTRRDAYLSWAESVAATGIRLMNPPELVRWSSDKVYLDELAQAGIPVVPTHWLPQQTTETQCRQTLTACMGIHPDADPVVSQEIVIKPTVGAGSLGAGRFRADELEAALDHLATLHAAGRSAMVQPYLHAVDKLGERALIYFNARFSHAITKAALLPVHARHELGARTSHNPDRELFVQENISAAHASARERAVADSVVDFLVTRFEHVPLYVRVDLLPRDDDAVVIEVELIEPSLFFNFDEAAPQRYAASLAARLNSSDLARNSAVSSPVLPPRGAL